MYYAHLWYMVQNNSYVNFYRKFGILFNNEVTVIFSYFTMMREKYIVFLCTKYVKIYTLYKQSNYLPFLFIIISTYIYIYILRVEEPNHPDSRCRTHLTKFGRICISTPQTQQREPLRHSAPLAN